MIFHPKGKIIPNASFFFNNNDFDVPVNPELIYPIERIHNNSAPCPALMKTSLLIIILKLL